MLKSNSNSERELLDLCSLVTMAFKGCPGGGVRYAITRLQDWQWAVYRRCIRLLPACHHRPAITVSEENYQPFKKLHIWWTGDGLIDHWNGRSSPPFRPCASCVLYVTRCWAVARPMLGRSRVMLTRLWADGGLVWSMCLEPRPCSPHAHSCKREALTQCCFNALPASTTLKQHWVNDFVWKYLVRWHAK